MENAITVTGKVEHAMTYDDYKTVVCPDCKNGDWQDHEPGDTIRCPWCERRVTLDWLERIE